ncbi:MAG TPA: TonB-dependent receptor [Pseudomonadales bacterium]|nr:TonB-dependent receptor [Pseudomonadales bacterium]
MLSDASRSSRRARLRRGVALASGLHTALFGALVASALPASAASVIVEEVVVTARRAAESLSDVPIAVTAFTSQDIADAGIERPEDFVNLTSNVAMVDTANIGDTQVTIRGITSTRDAESNFALVVDGVLITNPNAFNQELLDIAQIEVLKGPQGALYGRNASSGAILITTNKPSDEFEGTVSASVGNNDAYNVRGKISGPITDALAGSLSVSRRETDGFYSNRFRGGDNVDFLEDTTAQGRLVWEGDATTVDLRMGLSKAEGGAINFNATFALPVFQGFGTPGAELFFADVNEHDFDYQFNVTPDNEQETRELSLKIDHEYASGMTVTAIAAWNDLEESLISDGTAAAFGTYSAVPACAASVTPETIALVNDTPPAFLFAAPGTAPTAANSLLSAYTPTTCDGYQYQERNQEDLSLELRLASAQDGRIRWQVGGYYAQIEREVVVSYGADLGQGTLAQPYVPPTGQSPTDLLFWDDFDTTVTSVFGQFAIDLTERTELSIEARYDREDREVQNKVPAVASALAFGGGAPINPARTAVGDVIPDRDKTFSQLQPRIALNHRFSDAISAYASYGVGFRSGGFNSIGSEALTEFWFNSGDPFGAGSVGAGLDVNDEYDKEVTQSIELGAKGRWLDNRLQVNAAVFRTEVEDNQFFEFFAGPFGILRAVTTIDELEILGAEIDAKYQVTSDLQVFGGFGISDGEIKKNRHRPTTEGNESPLTPDYTLNLGAQYVKAVSPGIELLARADYVAYGKTWFHTVQDNQQPAIWTAILGFPAASDMSLAQRDAYGLLNLRLGLSGDQWQVTAWGRNVLEEDYLAEVIPAPEFGGSFLHQGLGRAYGVDLRYRF